MKIVYLYDAVTGEFKGTYYAQESPLEPGIFLAPVHSTEIAPPAPSANEVAVYASGSWVLQPDYRGQTIYNQATGASLEVTAIGAIPSGFGLSQPALPPTVIDISTAVQGELDSKAQAKQYQDCAVCIGYLNSSNATWSADAKAMNTWRDEVWTYALQQVALSPLPSVASVIAGLPAAPW